jgi:hypothetical protein
MQHPCCTQLSTKSLKHIMGRCEALNIICELHAGDALSGVKISGKFPWDLDADVHFVSANFSVLKQILTDSKKQGYGFTTFSKTTCCTNGRPSGGYMGMSGRGVWLDTGGLPRLTSEDLVAAGRPVTKVQYDGTWLATNANSAKFPRDFYGHEIFKHAGHWRDLKIDVHSQEYPAGSWMKCSRPGHQACLDKFNGDGNIQFKEVIP